jgi:hypothetical protein
MASLILHLLVLPSPYVSRDPRPLCSGSGESRFSFGSGSGGHTTTSRSISLWLLQLPIHFLPFSIRTEWLRQRTEDPTRYLVCLELENAEQGDIDV